MNKKVKKILSIVILSIFIVSSFNSSEVLADGLSGSSVFKIRINEKLVDFDDVFGYPKLIKETERTLIPLRIISEYMGYKVDWDQPTKTAFVEGGGHKIEVTIGDNSALVNGKRVHMDIQDGKPVDTKAMLLKVPGDINRRTYVPLRFISETTDANIEYERINGVNHIDITTSKVEKPEEKPVNPGIDNQSPTNSENLEFVAEDPTKKVNFKEPDFMISKHDESTHINTYFAFGIRNFNDYKGKSVNVSTELLNWDDFQKYRRMNLSDGSYYAFDNNKNFSNFDYQRLTSEYGMIGMATPF